MKCINTTTRTNKKRTMAAKKILIYILGVVILGISVLAFMSLISNVVEMIASWTIVSEQLINSLLSFIWLENVAIVIYRTNK